MLKKITLLSHLLIALTILTSSCATYRPIYSDKETIETTIKSGDTIKIKTTDNQEISFRVKSLNEGQIVGEKDTVNFNEIDEIKLETSSTEKNIFMGVLYALAITGYAIMCIPPAYGY